MLRKLESICYIVTGLLTLIILMAALGAQTLFTTPGQFLFDRFHLASLYIPALFAVCGILIRTGMSRKIMVILWSSPIVFLTFAIALQVSIGREDLTTVFALITALSRFPAALIFFLLFVLEIVGIARITAIDFGTAVLQSFVARFKNQMQKWSIFLGLADDIEEKTNTEEKVAASTLEFEFSAVPDTTEYKTTAKESFPSPYAPQKPLSPISPDSDPAITELVNRALESDTKKIQTTNTDSAQILTYKEFLENASENQNNAAISIPEEDHSDILKKLTPQWTEPKGIVATEERGTNHHQKQYDVPVKGILAEYPESNFSAIDAVTRRAGEILEQTLREFKIEATVTGIRKGPVITMYELLPSPGVKISSIVNLQDNIALRLAASRVRIVAPIPGKHAVGIEVPNKKRAIVSFSSLVESTEFQKFNSGIPVILGKDISGGNQIIDLTRTPHLLIAGATGSGKSVCVNSLVGSILYSCAPQKVKMIMVDPKIVELKLYNDIPHLLTPVITAPKKAFQALQWCLYEMERRYSLLDSQGVRDMSSYNRRIKERKIATKTLPYIVVIVDEFADLMATSGKELEGIVARLAAMSRAVGIHLVLATQRPSVDVITGLIKANFPSRIAFMVAGKTDSRIIIDSVGAEKLLGRGDMLFTSAWDPFPSRVQGAFLAEDEVERMAHYVKGLGEPDYIDEEMFVDEEDEEFSVDSSHGDDPMYEKALETVMTSRKASASYLQRRLKVGYNRAARLVEEMEKRGIVGPANGSKPRDIIHTPERFANPSFNGNREPSSA